MSLRGTAIDEGHTSDIDLHSANMRNEAADDERIKQAGVGAAQTASQESRDRQSTVRPVGGSDKPGAVYGWLRNLLHTGPVEAADIETAAKERGVAPRTLARMKKRLGVKSTR